MNGEHLTGLDRVTEPTRASLGEYARLLRDLAGDNAKTLTLFGAIAAGSFDPQRHTVRNALVVERVDLGMLRRLAEQGVKLGKARIAAPLIMTPAYIQASLDTFPLEFIEIRQQHITVFGEDRFDGLRFDDAYVRLQCERELKTILIGLRQGLLAAAGREKFIGALKLDAAEALMRTLRGLLWLKGQKDGKPAAEVIAEVEKIASRKLTGIRIALNPLPVHGWSEFESLYQDVEELGGIANAW